METIENTKAKRPRKTADELSGIGQKMREIRQKKKESLSAIGLVVGKDRSVINRYELGEQSIPADVLVEIAAFLKVPVSEFFKPYKKE